MSGARTTRWFPIRVDLYTRICLTAIAVLLTVVVIGLWTGSPGGAQSAWAGEKLQPPLPIRPILPDTGLQRSDMIDELRAISVRLDEIQKTLVSGQVKVTVIATEKPEEAQSNALPPKTK